MFVKNNIVHNDSNIANKNQNEIAFFVIDDAILSLTLKGRPFKPNFGQGLYLRSYLSLYQAVSAFGLNKSFDIAKKDYVCGYCMWGYDLTTDQSREESQLHPIKTGSLRIEFQFAEPLGSVINVVFTKFDNQIEINSLE